MNRGSAQDGGRRILLIFACLLTLASQAGCMSGYVKSVGGDTEQVFHRIYFTDFNTAWLSVLDAMKSNPLDISNREAGYVQTKWVDNTSQRNFVDSFGSGRTYLKAQFRFQVNVAKGFYNGRPSVKVAVQKEQLVEQDVLEGWRAVPSDSIDENTLLYRIGRVIHIAVKQQQIEERRKEKQISTFDGT